MSWTTAEIPSQTGRLAVVTGANSGLGYETALALAAAGAEVVLAVRNATRGAEAVARIRAAQPQARVRCVPLDLTDLASVRTCAATLCAEQRALDLLINNAGVMALPTRQVTVDGFERQFATNYLGHFALTAQLLPLLQRAPGARVVNVSSLAAHLTALDFSDLQSERAYVPFRTYGLSKLAQLLFTLELQRRSTAAGWGVMSVAAHPGFAGTALIGNGPASSGWRATAWRWLQPILLPFSRPVAPAALPTLFAATAPEAQGGLFYGPTGWRELMGPLGVAQLPPLAQDGAAAAQLWELSEQLTGVRF